jgi:uncharacterized repeat protein (TIGR03803 family)
MRSTGVLPSSIIQRLAVCGSILLFMVFSPMQLKAQPIYKVLYSFTGGADGGQPYAGVVFDKAGNLYGTAQIDGTHGKGTVFQLVPSQGSWTFNLVYTFTGGTDGAAPIGGVIVDSAGNLYGTTSSPASAELFSNSRPRKAAGRLKFSIPLSAATTEPTPEPVWSSTIHDSRARQ